MQAFCVITAQMTEGRPHIHPPKAFWDRQASYRAYRDAGGTIPRRHGLEPLTHWNRDQHFVASWHVVDIPDRKHYDPAFREQLVKRILDGELSQSEASRLYGPSQSRISEWVREYASLEEASRPEIASVSVNI